MCGRSWELHVMVWGDVGEITKAYGPGWRLPPLISALRAALLSRRWARRDPVTKRVPHWLKRRLGWDGGTGH